MPPNASAHPFADFRKIIEELPESQRNRVVGKGCLALIDAGKVAWADVVTPGRIRTLAEVIDRQKLTAGDLAKAGFSAARAANAMAKAHPKELVSARRTAKALAEVLKAQGMTAAEIAKATGEQVAAGLGIRRKPGVAAAKVPVKLPPLPAKPFVEEPKPPKPKAAAKPKSGPKPKAAPIPPPPSMMSDEYDVWWEKYYGKEAKKAKAKAKAKAAAPTKAAAKPAPPNPAVKPAPKPKPKKPKYDASWGGFADELNAMHVSKSTAQEAKEADAKKVAQKAADAASLAKGGPRNFREDIAGMEAWGKGASAAWAKGLSRDESAAVGSYTGSGYVYMTSYFRKDPGFKAEAARSGLTIPQAMERIGHLESSLMKASTPSPVVSYRGVKESAKLFGEAVSSKLVGKIVDEGAPTSTSLDFSTAEGFSRRGKSPAIFEFTVPAGTRAAYVNAGDLGIEHERELLVAPADARYRITGVDTSGEVPIIRAEILKRDE